MKLHRWLGKAATKGLPQQFFKKAQYSSSNSNNNGANHPSAGIIVIGDEILKAQVKDTNSFHVCASLYKLGVSVKKISVISDNVYDIAREIQDFSTKYKYVITTGGIGPTHDDVTFEALAMAFNDKLHHHPTLVDAIKKIFIHSNGSSSCLKMAQIPTKAILKFGVVKATGQKLPYPCVVLNNVYVFPGSPQFFKASFDNLYEELFPCSTDFYMTELFVNAYETTFAETLAAIAKEYPRVSFGSYPEYSRYYKARLTIESSSDAETEAAVKKLRAALPTKALPEHDREPHIECLTKYENFLRTLVPAKQEFFQKTFTYMLKFYFKPRQTVIYFDGSPESIVLVHLARATSIKIGGTQPIQVVTFERDVENPKLNEFLQNLSRRYNINIMYEPYNQNLQQLMRNLVFQNDKLTTLFVGARKTDLTSKLVDKLATFDDAKHLKVYCPLLEWTKADIDLISSHLSLPYFEQND